MKKSIFYALVAGIFAFAAASCGKPDDGGVTPPPADDPSAGGDTTVVVIPTPNVAGEAGKYTVAFRIPAALACDPVINFFGGFQDNNAEDPDAPVAVKIEEEGFENWYKVSFEAEDPAQAAGKICPQMGGVGTWNAQASEFDIIKGAAERVGDMGADKIKLNEAALADVVYVDVKEWTTDPCNQQNAEGPASYSVVILTEFPADINYLEDLEVTATVGWSTDAMTMMYDFTYDGPGVRYTGQTDFVKAGEAYKYVIKYKGGDWIYEKGKDRMMPYGNKANDEVTEWDSTPWNPIPAGEGTFEVTLCGAPAGEMYIAGNFTADGEAGWWAACAGDEAYKMTLKEGNTYTWTGAYPENFSFKVIDYVDADNQAWIGGPDGNFNFDGENFLFEAKCE